MRKPSFFVAALMMSIIFIMLGCWQVIRAFNKSALLHQLRQPPITLSMQTLTKNHIVPNMKYILENGQWRSELVVLDNQFLNDQLGMRVYGFYCDQSNCLLIRGPWMLKQQQPHRDWQQSSVSGLMRALPYVLIHQKEGESVSSKTGFPLLVSLDKDYLEKKYHLSLMNYELVQGASVVSPEKDTLSVHRHYAYALQFYLLALVCIIGYILAK